LLRNSILEINFLLILVEVTVKGPIDEKTGMVMNLTDLKPALLPDPGLLYKVEVKETDKNIMIYKGEKEVVL